MNRLDFYDNIPEGMKEYLSNYGWHFSKKMCEWAVSKMRDKNEKKVQMRSKEDVESILKASNIEIENDNGYDKVFVYHMCMSDYYGGSVPDDLHAARYVKETLDDKDGYEGIAFTRFFADCSGKGVPIAWEDML